MREVNDTPLSAFTLNSTYVAVFRTLVGAVRAIDHLVANERGRYTIWAIVAFPVTFLTSIDRGLAHDADGLLRLTIMDSPSRNDNINTAVQQQLIVLK